MFVCAWTNWKRTVIAWLSVCLLFNPVVCLRFQPPNLQLGFAVNSMLLCFYYIKERKSKDLYNGRFMFKSSFIAFFFSYLISSLFTMANTINVFTHTFQYFVNTFILLFLFHKVLTKVEDLNFFFKINVIVVVAIFLLGTYEFFLRDNPWLDYVYMSCNDSDLIYEKSSYKPPFIASSGELRSRFGMVRAYSFFEHPIRYGCACAMYITLYLWLYNRYAQKKLADCFRYILMVLLLFVGVIYCNSKTPFVGLPFFVLSVMPFKDLFSKKIFPFIISFLILGSLALTFSENIFDNFLALIDKSKMDEGGESTPELRYQQYAIGLSLWLEHPLWGNGPGSVEAMISQGNVLREDIGGSESSWLQILPERGVIGVIAYLILYYEMFKVLNIKMGKWFASFFLLGLMGLETATGVMEMNLYGTIILVLTRYKELYLQKRVQVFKIMAVGIIGMKRNGNIYTVITRIRDYANRRVSKYKK